MPTARTYQLHTGGRLEESAYLSALPSALIAVNRDLIITYLNPAAEMLFGVSRAQALGKELLLPMEADMETLLARVFAESAEISLYEQTLTLPGGAINVTLRLTPVIQDTGVAQALITIEKIDGRNTLAASEWKKEITRAAGVMAAMLAHEVKNPLSGIRGAAQLLKDEVAQEHKPLSELICTETDRIRDLLAQVEVFAAGAPAELQPVNIHEMLQRVIAIAHNGFARQVRIRELYDPSLPPVAGNHDLLVQLFLNLVKNAAEAMEGQENAELTIATTFKSGYRVRHTSALSHRERGGASRGDGPHPARNASHPPASAGAPARQVSGSPELEERRRLPEGEGLISLPIMVSISDNGPGIDLMMRARLFEPFASSKEEGRGLGLAVVAKIASDLGLVVELDENTASGARFNVMLPCAA